MYVGNRSDEHIYCKHDGSLQDGFEIVTHPMTLEYHMAIMPWKDITDKARKLGYTSHQAETCGLHIHVNRSSFGETVEDQDAAIGRVLYFVERNLNELLIFSRRTQEQLESWARRYGYKDQPKEMLEHAKKGYAGRYTCVNLTNYSTIEFRIFRGTLKLNTIYATLQLVNHICEVAVSMSDEEVRHLSWSRFVDLMYAVSQKYIASNPCGGAIWKEVTEQEFSEIENVLSLQQAQKLLKMLEKYSSFNTIVKLLMFTGMRSGECLGLR